MNQISTLFILVVGVCQGSVIPLHSTLLTPDAAQVRIQDELGQYHFSHVGGPNSRTETKTADGITRGGYSYVDGNGLLQSAAYVSDPVNGFRVAATNLPAGPAVPVAPAVVAAAPAVVAPAPAIVHAAPAVVSSPYIAGSVVSPVQLSGLTLTSAESVEVKSAEASPEPTPAPEATQAPSSTPEPSPAPVSEASSDDSEAVEAAPAPVNPYLPVQDTPEVLAARAQHLAAVEEVKVRDSEVGTEPTTVEPTETPETPEPTEAPSSPAPVATSTPAPEAPALLPAAIPAVRIAGPLPGVPVAPIAPVAAVAAPGVARVSSVAAPSVAAITAPVVAPIIAPAVPFATATQYRVQDELGQYAFGHAGGPNSREEVKTFDGITRGGYAYVDGNGLVQSAAYVSDPVNGFRVAATNLPVQPAPTYIAETPEVAEAKAALLKAQQEHIAKL